VRVPATARGTGSSAVPVDVGRRGSGESTEEQLLDLLVDSALPDAIAEFRMGGALTSLCCVLYGSLAQARDGAFDATPRRPSRGAHRCLGMAWLQMLPGM
jgi:hypothetical protein